MAVPALLPPRGSAQRSPALSCVVNKYTRGVEVPREKLQALALPEKSSPVFSLETCLCCCVWFMIELNIEPVLI